MIETVLARRSWSAYQIVVVAVIAAAWLILIIAPATPYAALVDHAQIEAHDVPPALRWAAFLTGWTLMAVAMMLPGNLAAMKSIVAVVETRAARGGPAAAIVRSGLPGRLDALRGRFVRGRHTAARGSRERGGG